MANVYENAFLTIAAASSENGGGGLFQTCGDNRIISGEYKGKPYTLRTVERIHHSYFKSLVMRSDFPLTGRGWTFQEQLLSPRVVYFTYQELIWECRNGCKCECRSLVDGDHSSYSGPEFRRLLYGPHPSDKTSQETETSWSGLIDAYTARKLTYDYDLLPAISSLASRWGKLRQKGRYLAGLWERELPICLMWRVNPGYPSRRCEVRAKIPPSCSPTWSWASRIGGEISIWTPEHPEYSLDTVSRVQIILAETSLSTFDPHGLVSGGRLVIRGCLLSVRPGSCDHDLILTHARCLHILPKYEEGSREIETATISAFWDTDDLQKEAQDGHDDLLESIRFLIVMEVEHPDHTHGKEISLNYLGLVLRCVDREASGDDFPVFTREGSGYVTTELPFEHFERFTETLTII
ncbi:hypothetical protein B0J11DRAFT_503168 [Dendryphion nanum]|uniref:Heterokaryon incompatibility domain-containing protein n=1 Tax=Dendryphion nanum TaxID=256645 RepID=A0A9P9E420_9PLEO|nr:hypothetical protein B0J11DRAFT_503168 [Dendryphion nanum]